MTPRAQPRSRKRTGFNGTLAEWLQDEAPVQQVGAGSIADVVLVRSLLITAAREGRATSYSEMLQLLGHRFTRPKMRALCKTLDAVDAAAAAKGEPELAVLVVREGDRLPGQGWWTAAAHRHGYEGPWTGADAAAFIRSIQEKAFRHWTARPA